MWRKNIKFLAFFSLIFAFPLILTAQQVAFNIDDEASIRTSMDLEGGYAHDLEVDNNSRVYVGLYSPNGIFYSDNDISWTGPVEGSDFGSIEDIEIGDDYVFMIAGINLYRSDDSGETWTELQSVNNVAQNFHYGGGKLFVPGRDGLLYISDDDGESFTAITVDSSVTYLGINSIGAATDSDNVYLIGMGDDNEVYKLYKSEDGGLSWSDTGHEFNMDEGGDLEVEVSPQDGDFILIDSATIYYSQDGGQTLEELNTESIVSEGDVEFANGDNRIFVGNYYTDDLGINWNEIGIDAEVDLNRSNLAIDPNDENHIYMSTINAVAVSDDGGVNWTEMIDDLLGVTVNDIAQSADEQTVWLATNQGLAKTTNFLDDEPIWTFYSQDDSYHAAYIDPDDEDSVLIGSTTGLMYSIDGGVNWTAASGDVANVDVYDFSVDNDGNIYAAYHNNNDGGGALISTDDGQSWTDMGLSDVPANAIAVDSGGNVYVAVGAENNSTSTSRGVYKYDGSSWTQLSGNIDGYVMNDLIIADDVIFVAAGATDTGSIFRSSDAGVTWEVLNEEDGLRADAWYHALTYEPNNTDVIYACTARPAGTSYIYKSIDGGDSWGLLYTGLKDEVFNALMFSGNSIASATTLRTMLSSKSHVGTVTGTNVGLYSLQSKAKITLKRNKKKVKKNKKVKLTATVKDFATDTVLTNKKVKLYRKYKKSKKWKYFKSKKTNSKGKVNFKTKVKKRTYYQVRWKAKKATMKDSYGSSSYKSSRRRVKIKK